MKKNKTIILLIVLSLLLTGCTKTLKDSDNKAVVNKVTGQTLTENILCRPTDTDTIKLYEEHKIDISSLPNCACESDKIKVETDVLDEEGNPIKDEEGNIITETKEVKCESFNINSGGYDGLWATIFVKPLAFVILFFGNITSNYGLGLIIVTILIRLIAYPITRKTAMQSENMKKAQPEIQRIEKKFENKDTSSQEVMAQKSQETMAIYKKYGINPISGCILPLIQFPLFIAFLEAINRVPAIFEESLFGLHLGTTPSIAIQNGSYWEILLILFVAGTTYFSFKATGADQAMANNDMAKQQKMMGNIFTIMIIVMSIFMSNALGIYWGISNLFTIGQNLLVKRSAKK